jgi:hypothetical protein
MGPVCPPTAGEVGLKQVVGQPFQADVFAQISWIWQVCVSLERLTYEIAL